MKWTAILAAFLLAACVSTGPAGESLDSIARDYVKLQLSIGEKEKAISTLITGRPNGRPSEDRFGHPGRAAHRAGVLSVRLRSLDDGRLDRMELRRRDFLLAQLKAASTRLAMMQGAKYLSPTKRRPCSESARAEAALGLRSDPRPQRAAGAGQGPARRPASTPSRTDSPSPPTG